MAEDQHCHAQSNSGEFIEETIRSVLLQGYPSLEYIIIDGESTDNSIEVIKKYEPWLARWVTEADGNPAIATNKGFFMATGKMLTALSSNDTYLPDAFQSAAGISCQYKHEGLFFGDFYFIDKAGGVLETYKGKFLNRRDLIKWWDNVNPAGACWFFLSAIFFPGSAIQRIGAMDTAMIRANDYDLLIKLSGEYKCYHINKILAAHRVHDASMSLMGGYGKLMNECIAISKKYWGKKVSFSYWYYWISLEKSKWRDRSKKLYNSAEENWKSKNRFRALQNMTLSMLLFPPRLFNRNCQSIFLHCLLGDKVVNKCKEFQYFFQENRLRR